jgi:hypothetical protein
MALLTPLITLVLFAAMLLLIEVGHRLRGTSGGTGRDGDKPGSTVMESAVFALFGLLLAFTFSGAMGRYDAHRQLIVQEANNIGTAYLRLDLLPTSMQPALRQNFRDYTAIRAHSFDVLDDTPEANEAAAQTARLQKDIWTRSVAGAFAPGATSGADKLLLPALNDMIDITATRKNAFDMHPPTIVFALLFVLACGCAVLAGFGATGRGRSWVQRIGFAAAISLTLYASLDIEYPRRGLVTLASRSQVFTDLIQSMH